MTNEYPLVSFLILTYNQERYIKSALDGAIAQDYPDLEIIISDDCSTDATPQIIEDWLSSYTGGRVVRYNHNETNIGLVRHLKKAMSLANGDYLVMAAGDDISLPNRTQVSVSAIKKMGVDSLALNFEYIDKDGNQLGRRGFDNCGDEVLFTKNDYVEGRDPLPSGPSRVITRRLIEEFGPLDDDCQTEDTTTTFRSILLGGVGHCSEVGVLYRWHGDNISSKRNLMTKINPVKIYQQYKRDLDLAFQKGLVDQNDYRAIKKRILSYKAEQVYIRRLYNSTSKIIRLIWHVMFWFNPRVPLSLKTKDNLKSYWPKMYKRVKFVKKLIKK